jgi:hypothetical protein
VVEGSAYTCTVTGCHGRDGGAGADCTTWWGGLCVPVVQTVKGGQLDNEVGLFLPSWWS